MDDNITILTANSLNVVYVVVPRVAVAVALEPPPPVIVIVGAAEEVEYLPGSVITIEETAPLLKTAIPFACLVAVPPENVTVGGVV